MNGLPCNVSIRLLEMNASIAEDLEEQEAISESAAETYLTQLKWKKIYNIPTSETSANTACERTQDIKNV